MTHTLFTNAMLSDKSMVDVEVSGGIIYAVGPVGTIRSSAARVDLDGKLLLPAPAEPHAHLDKALLADRADNKTGDLQGAIAAMREIEETTDQDDVIRRASEALMVAAQSGSTVIRSHVDVGPRQRDSRVRAVKSVIDVVDSSVDVELCALVSPVSGPDGPAGLRALHEAVESGVTVIGGCPVVEPDPTAAIHTLVDVAASYGLDLDLHVDERVEHAEEVVTLARYVLDRGFSSRVTASHCVSLSTQPSRRFDEVAELLRQAGVGVVALPQSNLALQQRDQKISKSRGIVPITALLERGVLVAAGGDNWRDPFNPVGRIDALETASLLVSAAHVHPQEALALVTTNARKLLGRPRAGVEVGDVADLIAVRATTVLEAIGAQPSERLVISAGVVIATTEVRTSLTPQLEALRSLRTQS